VLLTLTTTGKVTLLIVAGAFILWALITAIWIPKRNPDFPITLTGFVLVSCVFFALQMGAVYWVTGTQEVETEEVAEAPVEEQPTQTETSSGDPQAGGDAAVVAGKEVFLSAEAGCGSCHTLADAGTEGSVGPNLDEGTPSAELVVDRVTNGKGVMPAFEGKLTEEQIADLAAYVSTVAGASS
jgi:cytochrome c6